MSTNLNPWIVIGALVGLFCSPPAKAVDVGAGLAAVDDMSDNAQPAATIRFGWTDSLYSQFYYWGRDFGPVSERYYVLTLAAERPAFGSQYLVVHYGAAASVHDI